MKRVILIAFFTLAVAASLSAQSLKPSDIKRLEGGKWTGTLTYLDYSSGKPTSIESNITITLKTTRAWTFAYEYPREPKANSSDRVELSRDGRMFDGEAVTSLSRKNGVLSFVTTKTGQDNDRPAIIRHTYTISKAKCTVKKEVLIDGETTYFERSTYSWTR